MKTYYMHGDPDVIEDGVAATLTNADAGKYGRVEIPKYGYKKKHVRLSDIEGLFSVSGAEGLITLNSLLSIEGISALKLLAQDKSINLGSGAVIVRKLSIAFELKRLQFSEAKKQVGKFNPKTEVRKEWLAKVEAARNVEEEYLEYIPLTEAEKIELFKRPKMTAVVNAH